MFWKILSGVLAALLVFLGAWGYFCYGKDRYNAGQQAGYQAGYDEGYLAYADPEEPGPALKEAWDKIKEQDALIKSLPTPLQNPDSLEELMAFVVEDPTNLVSPHLPERPSAYFACTLYNNAVDKGFRTGYVELALSNGSTYSLVVFDVQEEMVFIDPQMDVRVKVDKEKGYSEQNGWGYLPGNEIVEVFVHWSNQ